MHKINTLFLVLLCSQAFSQVMDSVNIGIPSREEFEMTKYINDEEAPAVILYEKGATYYKYANNELSIYKEYHQKIKVFNAAKYDDEPIVIELFKSKAEQEKLISLRAYTHNGAKRINVEDLENVEEITDDNYVVKKISFPSIKDGSILELSYTIKSPFIYDIGDWFFQGALPTIYSEYTSEIPFNYYFKKNIYGINRLDYKKSVVKKKCFAVSNKAFYDCERSTFVMRDIPAYQPEPYTLSYKNYVYRLEYRLSFGIDFYGNKLDVISSWREFDKLYTKNSWFELETEHVPFFKRMMPKELFEIENDLKRAKAVYYFIQNHYAWDNETGIEPINIKKAFKTKKANMPQINTALYNGLKAANFKPKLFLSSSNDNAIPDKKEYLFSTINLLSIFVTIDGKEYVLDASKKNLPFGLVDPDNLNRIGRVVNFNNKNYWYTINPRIKSSDIIRTQITANDVGIFTGDVKEIKTGYVALAARSELKNLTLHEFELKKEKSSKNSAITFLKIEHQNDDKLPLEVRYKAVIEVESKGNKKLLYPFFFDHLIQDNPFEAKERLYDVDFGFPFNNTYSVSIDVKDSYTIVDLPENTLIKLPNNAGTLSVVYTQIGSIIHSRLQLQVKKNHFKRKEYPYLKKFFDTFIENQSDTPIVLKAK